MDLAMFVALWLAVGFIGTWQMSRDGAGNGTVFLWLVGISLGLLWLPAIVLRFYLDND